VQHGVLLAAVFDGHANQDVVVVDLRVFGPDVVGTEVKVVQAHRLLEDGQVQT